jgi:hypothetical protein
MLDCTDRSSIDRSLSIRGPASVEEYASTLDEEGVPAEFVSLLAYLFSEVLDGRNAHLAGGVQRALGREPRDFGDYARNAAEAGIWNPLPHQRVDAA